MKHFVKKRQAIQKSVKCSFFLQINRLEDLGVEVAAWVLIHNNDKSSLIRHMGSQKGREFIKCKPDIDAELHLFLQNYKKKGKFRVFFFEIYNFWSLCKLGVIWKQ